jgi:acyl-CoA thioesterase
MFVFDEDTRVSATGMGKYVGNVSERWSIGPVPNGGYVLTIGLSALGQALDRPDPLTVTGHFVRPAAPGPIDVLVEVVKSGRAYATGMARLVQNDKEVLRVLATYGTLENGSPVRHVAGAPPRFERLVPRSTERLPEIAKRFEVEADEESIAFLFGKRAPHAEIRGRMRFADGRRPDTRSLALLADAMPPPVFNLIDPGWVPTLELTVHMRARPTTEWLSCVFRTRFVFEGLLEEDGELWDESGQLVAQSRQLAALPRSAWGGGRPGPV